MEKIILRLITIRSKQQLLKSYLTFYVSSFAKVNSSCPKPKVRVWFWYSILSWNNGLCFRVYLTWFSLPDQDYSIFWWNILPWKNVLCFFVLPSTWAHFLCLYTKVNLTFWWKILPWNNVLCSTIYLSIFSIPLPRFHAFPFTNKPNPLCP